MFEHLTMRERLRIEQEKNRQLMAALAQARGDMEYIAMMTDVDLDQGEDVEHE